MRSHLSSRLVGRVGATRERAIREARARFFVFAAGFSTYVSAEVDQDVFIVSTSDTSLGPSLFRKRSRKEFTRLRGALALLKRHGIPLPGQTFVDVGANIGTTTISALRNGFTQALAFEAAPANVRLLRANVALNGLDDRIDVFPLALSHAPGEVLLEVGGRSSGKPRVVAARRKRDVLAVPAATLDDLGRSGSFDPARVGLVWMDVEGHEASVLAGATDLRARGVPLVFELNPKLLEPAGALDAIAPLIEESYTHVVDLGEGADAAVQPAAAVAELLERYGPSRFTDVLAFRRADA